MSKSIPKIPPNLQILKLTFLFFGTGLSMFLGAMIVGAWLIPDLVELSTVRTPKGWFLAHLLLLGWATMVAMGASFQLTQVIMRTTLFSKMLGYIQFVLHLAGVIGLMLGFYTHIALIIVGGVSVAIAGILYVYNLLMTCRKRKEWNVFVLGVSLSLGSYLLTIFLGIAMGMQAALGTNAHMYEATFHSHLWFGIAGWLSGLIIVYSLKLLPMFYVSTKKAATSGYWIIGLYHIGVLLHVISIWSEVQWLAHIATGCMVVGLSLFINYIFAVRKYRRGRLPIGTVKVAFYLLPMMFVLFIAWSIAKLLPERIPNLTEGLIVIIILGWFSASILSYLFKIIPFLWWPHRYQTKEQRKSAVLLYEMLPGNRMTMELIGYLVGIILVVGGFIIENSTLALVGQMIATCFVVIYLMELQKVFRY